jgi:hypothetical protein
MGFDAGTIYRTAFPFHVCLLVSFRLQSLEYVLPGSVALPAHEAVITGLVRAIAFGQVSPGRSGAVNPEDAVNDQAVVFPLAAAFAGFLFWQVGMNAFPLAIGHITTRHRCVPPVGKYADASLFVRHALGTVRRRPRFGLSGRSFASTTIAARWVFRE